MIGGAASLLLALGLGSAALPVADFDIPYFLANPQVHEEMLRRWNAAEPANLEKPEEN